MLKENLKALRRQKGMSQEILAQQLNAVRQTVSKWEKGLSVPDADMLICIADLFDTSVSELLGDKIEQKENVSEIAVQLALLNEQLAQKAKIRRRIIVAIAIIVFVGVIASIYPLWNEVWHNFGGNLYHLLNE